MAACHARWVGGEAVGSGRAPTASIRPRLRAPAASGSGVSNAEKQPRALPSVVVETGLLGDRRQAVALTAGGAASAAASSSSGGSAPVVDPLAALRAFFLPTGWPLSVTPDYLAYQLATVPAHISGWMSHSLATSSMIQALGVDAGPATAVATTAAIKWITKDGLGAAGRLIVGGQLASVFDEDPKRWRMVAEAISTGGLALEIATQIFPGNFVALAGAGTLAKSMAKGMGRPCFRVVQTHFSATNNVGDVAAKEEVWEVAAQLLGLASSVAVLQLMEAAGRPELVVPVWAAVHAVHVSLRYVALSALRFPYPNQKRAVLLASGHVGSGQVPSIDEANAAEQILLPASAYSPRVVYGCSLDEALPACSGVEASRAEQLAELVQLYHGERYLLTWDGDTAWVLVTEGAQRVDLMRAMWQAAWLEQHCERLPAAGSNGSGGGAWPATQLLAASLEALRQRWPDFAQQAQQQGWLLEKSVFPQGSVRLRLE